MNILITGASRGLGLQIAREQIEAGNKVFAASRNSTFELSALAEEYPGQLEFLELDLADSTSLSVLFSDAIPHEIELHGFVNNAAMAYDDLVTNADLAQVAAMFQTNVLAPIHLTKQVIRRMLLHNTRGSLVHISSISAHTGYKGLSMYAATKGAIEAFSKNVAREWGSKGIRSNCVVAGFMETSMSSTLSDEQRQRIYQRTALKKPTDKESVAATVGFLLSAASHSITGQNLFVDSGTI